MTPGGVVGWVAGAEVLAGDLDAYMGALGRETVGERLGLLEGFSTDDRGAAGAGRFGAGAGGFSTGERGFPAEARSFSAGDRVTAAGSVGGAPNRQSEGWVPTSALSKQAALRAWAAKALLTDRLVAVEAARLGVSNLVCPDEWVRALLARGEICVSEPSEIEALAAYAANSHRYRAGEARRVRHLLVAERALAERLAGEARSAPPMEGKAGPASVARLAELAARWSLDEGSRRRGGELGWVERGQLTGALEQAIFSAKPGEVCGPVESGFGWHVLVVEELRAEHTAPFVECKEQIMSELTADRRRAAFRQWWARRLSEAIVVPPGSEHPCYPGLPGSVHRH
jgi:hypothetical protein